jgi:uncharacterized protein GlcG (DUF336 family)
MAYGKIKADTLVYDNSGSDTEVTIASLGNKVDAANPTFTGTVTIPTPAANDNTTKAASTAYVQTELGDYAALHSPTFTGLATFNNLTVNGTTTTINSTTLNVDDKNIELGKVGTPTDTTADGGGITLKGASDKTFNWVDATDAWTSSEHIHVGDDKKLLVGTGSDLSIYHNGSHSFISNVGGTGNVVLYGNGTNSIVLQAKEGENGIIVNSDGSSELYHDNSKKIETTAVGVTVTGTVTDTKGELRKIPRNDQTSNYTAVSADAGKAITANMGSGTVTINANVFAEGDALTLLNYSSTDLTIAQGSGFGLTNSSDAATGNRTLAAKGMATIYFLGGTAGYISGAGLS